MARRCSVLLVLLAAPIGAQTPDSAPRPSFEVASIKRNTTGDQTGFATPQPGRFVVSNIPLRFLILRAYRLQSYQLAGGEPWIESERYDITATIPAGSSPAQQDLMLQLLLEQRFGLVLRRETREVPISHLVVARADGRLGSAVKPAAATCDANGRPLPGDQPAGPQALPAGFAKGVVTGCRALRTPGWFMFAGQPMAAVASALTATLATPVVDRTGMTGAYDFSLSFTPDDRSGLAQLPAEFPPVDLNGPSLRTALQEQLGLRLESARGPIEVTVIERASRPTEN